MGTPHIRTKEHKALVKSKEHREKTHELEHAATQADTTHTHTHIQKPCPSLSKIRPCCHFFFWGGRNKNSNFPRTGFFAVGVSGLPSPTPPQSGPSEVLLQLQQAAPEVLRRLGAAGERSAPGGGGGGVGRRGGV